MTEWSAAHAWVDAAARSAPFNGLLKRRYDRVFEANREANLFRGVFATFDEAARSAPATRPLGYDNPDSAAMYLDRARRTYPTDYPMLFWLQKLFAQGARSVFDLGGHIGVSYYAYRKHLDYPAGLRWNVHDVPAVMAQGRRLAAEREREGRLAFSDTFEEADGFDILATQGAIQYLPDTLEARLARLDSPPPHLLLNLTPLHERESYFALQSVGTAYCPYRIFAAGDFLRAFETLGYALVDTWENPDKSCRIPFHPDRSLDRYHGFYFRRTGS
ncbi:MAG: methyltransferase, TIGR04325 family [Betaproteobacteria bacterium]|nr:methyltransferase, TIGR04325 family [Betaproteobacteria bacterium]